MKPGGWRGSAQYASRPSGRCRPAATARSIPRKPGLFGEPGGTTAFTSYAADAPGAVAPAPTPLPSLYWGRGWGEAYGSRARTDGWRGLPGERRDTRGFAGGLSYAPVPWLLIGFGIDHGEVDLDVPRALERAGIELTQIAGVARFMHGPFSLAFSGVYGEGSADVTRALLSVSGADYDVRLWGGFVEAGYRFDLGPWRITPQAGFDHVRIETDGFLESGVFGLVARPHEADRSRAFGGLEIGRSFLVGETATLDLTGQARAVAVVDGGERTLPVAFAAAPDSRLIMRGIEEDGVGVDVGGQARLGITANIGLYAAYEGRFRDGYTAHAGTAGVKIVW